MSPILYKRSVQTYGEAHQGRRHMARILRHDGLRIECYCNIRYIGRQSKVCGIPGHTHLPRTATVEMMYLNACRSPTYIQGCHGDQPLLRVDGPEFGATDFIGVLFSF